MSIWWVIKVLAGLALLAADVVAVGVWSVSVFAIVQQSRLEDRSLQTRSPRSFGRWAQQTRLIVPGIL